MLCLKEKEVNGRRDATPQLHERLIESCKLYLHLLFLKWLTATRTRAATGFIQSGIWKYNNLKIVVSLTPMKFSICFLFQGSLWSIITNFQIQLVPLSQMEKKEFLKKPYWRFTSFKLFEFLAICTQLIFGISLNR